MRYYVTIQTNYGKTEENSAYNGDIMEFVFEILDGIPNPRIANMTEIRDYCYHYRTINSNLSACAHTQQLDVYYPFDIRYPSRIEKQAGACREIYAYIGRRKKMPLSDDLKILCEEWSIATVYKILTGRSLEDVIDIFHWLDKPLKEQISIKHVHCALEFAKAKFKMDILCCNFK